MYSLCLQEKQHMYMFLSNQISSGISNILNCKWRFIAVMKNKSILAIFDFNKGPAPISLDNRKYIFRRKKKNIKKIAYVSNFVCKREREKTPLYTVVP